MSLQMPMDGSGRQDAEPMPHLITASLIPSNKVRDLIQMAFIKKYIPELAHLKGDDLHEPWESDLGYKNNYPKRIVDHAAERLESLARLEEIKAAKPLKP